MKLFDKLVNREESLSLIGLAMWECRLHMLLQKKG